EGIPANINSGLDEDDYDPYCDHLMLLMHGEVVATYRLLYGPRRPEKGFYTESEFFIKGLPVDFDRTVELGRACIHPKYRMKTTLMTLFWGIHLYAVLREARYLMGCT